MLYSTSQPSRCYGRGWLGLGGPGRKVRVIMTWILEDDRSPSHHDGHNHFCHRDGPPGRRRQLRSLRLAWVGLESEPPAARHRLPSATRDSQWLKFTGTEVLTLKPLCQCQCTSTGRDYWSHESRRPLSRVRLTWHSTWSWKSTQNFPPYCTHSIQAFPLFQVNIPW